MNTTRLKAGANQPLQKIRRQAKDKDTNRLSRLLQRMVCQLRWSAFGRVVFSQPLAGVAKLE